MARAMFTGATLLVSGLVAVVLDKLFAPAHWIIPLGFAAAICLLALAIDGFFIGGYFVGKGKRLRNKNATASDSDVDEQPTLPPISSQSAAIRIRNSRGVRVSNNKFFTPGPAIDASDVEDFEADGNLFQQDVPETPPD